MKLKNGEQMVSKWGASGEQNLSPLASLKFHGTKLAQN